MDILTKLTKILFKLSLIILGVFTLALVATINSNKDLPSNINDPRAENLTTQQKFKIYWKNDPAYEDGIYHESEDFTIMIHLTKPKRKYRGKKSFVVFITTKILPDTSNLIDTTVGKTSGVSYDEKKGIYNQHSSEIVFETFETEVIFDDGTEQLVRKPRFMGRSSHLLLRYTKIPDSDSVLMFLVNAKNDYVNILITDKDGKTHSLPIYVKGLKDWVFKWQDEAVFMGY